MPLPTCTIVANIAIDTTGQVSHSNYTQNESTIACLLQSNDSQLPFEYYWTLIPTVLTSLIGDLILKIISLEFTLARAQSPARMKADFFLVSGMQYLALLTWLGSIYRTYSPLYLLLHCLHVSSTTFWQCFFCLQLALCHFVITSQCYKLCMRQRTINIHLIVEEHYERYLDQEEEYLKAAGIIKSYDTRLAAKQQQLRIQL